MEQRPLNLYILSDALLEVSLQLSMVVISWIDWVFTEHLLVSNIVSAALLLGLADFSIQTLEIFVFRTREDYESKRNYRSMQVGMVLGIFNHLWYAFLESYLQGSGLAIVFKKIAFDQAVAGPFFSSAFLVGMGLLEGKSTAEVYEEWNQKFIHIYMVDWMFWPLAQFINFHMVPYRFRVFYVNFATFLWNTFLCYAKHHSEEVIRKRHRDGHAEKKSSSLDCHRSPKGKNNSKHSSNRKVAGSLAKPGSRVRKSPASKHGSLMSCSRCSPRPGTQKRRRPSSRAQNLPAVKPSREAGDRSSTIQSIISFKKIFPMIKPNSKYNESKTGFNKGSQEAPWLTQDCRKCTALARSCSTSGSSINSTGSYRKKGSITSSATTTTTTRSTNNAKNALFMAGEPAQPQCVKVPAIRKLGIFAEEGVGDKKKNSCVQGITPRRQVGATTPLSLRAIPAPRRKPGARFEAAAVPTAHDTRRRSWAGKSGCPVNTLRSHPIRPARTTAQTLTDVSETLQELRILVDRGQQEVRDALADTQNQVSRLQELCAVTYVSVDDGTRELALKADQLASWVQEEREFKVEQVKIMMEEVLTSKLP